jgi:PhnB protein
MRPEKYIRNHGGNIRPYIYGGTDLLEFVKKTFGAIEVENNKMANGCHVETQIGDSMMVLALMDPPYEKATKASIYVYVEDVDATYERALAAGAKALNPPKDQPYQERNAGVTDTFGNIWYISTYTGK